jgi:GNAT superfamily N-acetyltransferase
MMTSAMHSQIILLGENHLDAYVSHSEIEAQHSGQDGDPVSSPYSQNEPFEPIAYRQRTKVRWETGIDGLGWRRTWGVFDDQILVAHAELCGADLISARHRCRLGMSVARGYRRKGMGQALLDTAIEWAKAQSSIAWIDLCVFTENMPAYSLYQKNDFTELGRRSDCFRVDGQKIDNIDMTLDVSC